jgi:hypothetical protein
VRDYTPEQLKFKAQWQAVHHQWRLAVDAGNKAEAERLMSECDKLLPLFSKVYRINKGAGK